MKLTPVQILACLGFTVPEDGIEVAPTAAAFHLRTLQGLGATMDAEAIDDKELLYSHALQAGSGVWHAPGAQKREAVP